MNIAIKLLLQQIGEKAVESARPILARFAAKRASKLRKEAEEKTDPAESMMGGA